MNPNLPPQNLDAEASLIASLMLEPSMLDEVSDSIRPDEFYLETNRTLFEAIQSMRNAAKSIDPVTLAEEVSGNRAFAGMDVSGLLLELWEKLPTAAHAKHYAEIVREKALRRFSISAATSVIQGCYRDDREIEEFLGEAESKIHSIIARKAGATAIDFGSLMLDALAVLEKGKTFGVTSGSREIDKLTHGWQPGTLVILAARPSVGKTAMALDWIRAAASSGVGTAFFSLEQSRLEIADRLLSKESRVPLTTMRDKAMAGDIGDAMCRTANAIGQWKVIVDDTPSRIITSIAGAARLFVRKEKIGLIVVDYIQLVRPTNPAAKREEQVAEISRSLKGLARSLSVPVICLAQLNRQSESTTDKEPQLWNLRESGAIEQDADIVLMPHRPAMYDATQPVEFTKLFIRKNRNGETGMVKLHWDGPTMQFREWSDATPPADFPPNYSDEISGFTTYRGKDDAA
jgi:replicative DNA helicase